MPPLELNGTTGVSQVQAGAVESGDLASGAIGSGDLPAGSVIQVVQGIDTGSTISSSTSFISTGLSASITPTLSSSKILIIFNSHVDTQSVDNVLLTIFRNSQNLGDADWGFVRVMGSQFGNRKIATYGSSYLDSPSTTNTLTYTMYARKDSGGSSFTAPGEKDTATIQLMEIAG